MRERWFSDSESQLTSEGVLIATSDARRRALEVRLDSHAPVPMEIRRGSAEIFEPTGLGEDEFFGDVGDTVANPFQIVGDED